MNGTKCEHGLVKNMGCNIRFNGKQIEVYIKTIECVRNRVDIGSILNALQGQSINQYMWHRHNETYKLYTGYDEIEYKLNKIIN